VQIIAFWRFCAEYLCNLALFSQDSANRAAALSVSAHLISQNK